jgi:hypothetical protein
MFKVKCPIETEPLSKVTHYDDEKECKKRVNKVIDDDDEQNLNEQLPIISDAQVVDLDKKDESINSIEVQQRSSSNNKLSTKQLDINELRQPLDNKKMKRTLI